MTQLSEGIQVEEEHKPTYDFIVTTLEATGKLPTPEQIYEHIAKDHLEEIADYYTRLKLMETEAKSLGVLNRIK